MKIFINTYGSRGDVYPFIVLAKALVAKGHQVMICTSNRFESEIKNAGLEYGYITDAAMALLDADKTILEDSLGIWGILRMSLKMVKIAKPINKQMVIDAWLAAKSFQPDLIVYHPKALGALSIAEKLKAPAVLISLFPMLAQTAQFPMPGMPRLGIGAWYNRLSYRLVLLGYGSYVKGINEVRREYMALGKLPKGTGITRRPDGTMVQNIHAISPHVLARPKDWPAACLMGGYLMPSKVESRDDASLKTTLNIKVNQELQAFLDAGEPPVYIGFGSMSGSNPERLTKLIINALLRAGVRGVLATGWGGIRAGTLPASIVCVEQVDHSWLFKKMSAIVHHGGAGTTAAACSSGVPSIICPFMGDQPFWGKQVENLGVGLRVSSQKKLSSVELSDAIHRVRNDQTMKRKSHELARKLAQEDGVANIVSIIEMQASNLRIR